MFDAKKFTAPLVLTAALILMLSITAHSFHNAATMVLMGIFYIFAPGWIFVNTFLKEAILIEKITISIALGMIFLSLASAYASLLGFKLSAAMMAGLIITIIIIAAGKKYQEHKKNPHKHRS